MSQLLEDRHIMDDFIYIKKKVDSLAAALMGLKTDESSQSSKLLVFDTSIFVEQSIFSDFQKSFNQEVDKLKELANENKKYIDEILKKIKFFVGEKDLKLLEGIIKLKLDILKLKIEELKLFNLKRFADKNDTAKNIKYLDTQIKHIIDVYIKKMEKGDNWLIAKKPIGGNSCASCESYIGDLQDHSQFLPWNKVPQSDRLYRVFFIIIKDREWVLKDAAIYQRDCE